VLQQSGFFFAGSVLQQAPDYSGSLSEGNRLWGGLRQDWASGKRGRFR
jgi:hypothetical protein